jgi:hypothetical protein
MITRISPARLFTILAAFAVVVWGLFAASQATAGDNSAIVDRLPAQIPEILTGGSWKNGDIGGVYRAVVVMAEADAPQSLAAKAEEATTGSAADPTKVAAATIPVRKAEVYIQWIANSGTESSKIVKTVSIKEFNEKQLRHAFLAMNTLKDNEVTLLVTAYDEDKDKDVSVSVKATTPGIYEAANR